LCYNDNSALMHLKPNELLITPFMHREKRSYALNVLMNGKHSNSLEENSWKLKVWLH